MNFSPLSHLALMLLAAIFVDFIHLKTIVLTPCHQLLPKPIQTPHHQPVTNYKDTGYAWSCI